MDYIRKIINTIPEWEWYDRLIIERDLECYQNADRVWQVLELRQKYRNISYTLYPIIINIGKRTAEQYIADVQKAVREFENERLEAYERMCK